MVLSGGVIQFAPDFEAADQILSCHLRSQVDHPVKPG